MIWLTIIADSYLFHSQLMPYFCRRRQLSLNAAIPSDVKDVHGSLLLTGVDKLDQSGIELLHALNEQVFCI